jgi:alginate O-acetyltransferase complex protein AlgI
MVFTELRFVWFFLLAFSVYWLLKSNTWRKVWLLGCSYVFYGAWDWRFLALLWLSTGVDFAVGLTLARCKSLTARRVCLWLSLAGNLGMLGAFKYFGFFVESAQDFCAMLGLPFQTGTLNIILPIGISFYTFQTLNYVIDVYRGRMQPTRNLLDFALFVAFFPHLVAGPIVRAHDFLPQFARPRRWDWARMNLGVQLLVMGLAKKLIIGDRMAMFADPVFADPEYFRTAAAWAATVAFALQVYGDFSGYSDMAVGLAHMLGYKLAKNFDMPFAAPNITEFWRRWHITLSAWLRDYLYIPLGGSRCSRWRSDLNLFLTMVICGLWHGASWTYVIFGALHGCLLVGHRYFQELAKAQSWLAAPLTSGPGTALRIAATFLTFCCTLVIFRADTLDVAWKMFGRMFWPATGAGLPLNERGLWLTIVLILVCHIIGAWKLHKLIDRLPAPVQGLSYASAAIVALVLCPQLGKAFIYFQF